MIVPIRARAVRDDAADGEYVHAGRRRLLAVVAVEIQPADLHAVRQLVDGVEDGAVHLVSRHGTIPGRRWERRKPQKFTGTSQTHSEKSPFHVTGCVHPPPSAGMPARSGSTGG